MGYKVDAFLNQVGLQKTASMEKTAEELYIEKLSHVNETVEASTTLRFVGEELAALSQAEGLTKQASEMLQECAEGLLVAGEAMLGGLQKVAAENTAGMVVDMVHVADGMTKIASTLNEIAANGADEQFVKMANAVTSISNSLVDELNELAEQDESVAAYIAENVQ